MTQAMRFPPESIEQLRLLSKQLQSGELDLPIGRKIFEALLKMLEQPDVIAVSTIVEISQLLAISPASITRLTKLLGFSGFNAFQKLFKQANSRPTDFYSDNLRHLFQSKTGNNRVNTASFLQQQAQMVCASLQQLTDPNNVEQVANDMVARKCSPVASACIFWCETGGNGGEHVALWLEFAPGQCTLCCPSGTRCCNVGVTTA